MKSCAINTELFIIPDNGKYIVYSPLRKFAFQANRATVDLLDTIFQTGKVAVDRNNKSVLDFLEEHYILNGPDDRMHFSESEKKFEPTTVTIFPTTDCNLRCVYCYARGGEKQKYVEWQFVKAAIDFVVTNAAKTKKREFRLAFHGGGEPTLAWDIIVRAYEYAKRLAKKNRLKMYSGLGSNGILEETKIDWIAQHFDSINISFDGPKDIQNLQRPMLNGKGSYNSVYETTRRFDELGFRYTIRSTISDKSARRMKEIVDFFNDSFNVKWLHFEPLSLCGRCEETKWKPPKQNLFSKEFKKAFDRAQELGIKLRYSGARVEDIIKVFCGAAGKNFSITPEGYVTSCHEVSEKSDSRSRTFFFGMFEKKRQKFKFDYKKLNNLKERTVDNLSCCSGCYCKWHCAGGCLAKSLPANGNLFEPKQSQCIINREIVKFHIKRILKKGKLNLSGKEDIKTFAH